LWRGQISGQYSVDAPVVANVGSFAVEAKSAGEVGARILTFNVGEAIRESGGIGISAGNFAGVVNPVARGRDRARVGDLRDGSAGAAVVTVCDIA
jgi:hypothetical protein